MRRGHKSLIFSAYVIDFSQFLKNAFSSLGQPDFNLKLREGGGPTEASGPLTFQGVAAPGCKVTCAARNELILGLSAIV